jgi:hypothetical protein
MAMFFFISVIGVLLAAVGAFVGLMVFLLFS